MPSTQLEAYVAQHGSSLDFAGERIQVRNFIQRTAESVTAEFLGSRNLYLGRCDRLDDDASSSSHSEVWELIRISGRGNVAGRLMVENQTITQL
ncbi:hypothetical protein [Pseudomonas sp. On1]|uniref:hypothetical protein n=1 Tax=Pseudomonas sp. On1 TaxID=3083258 RepID=UPI0023500175|nr:hypothetical protein [Pseudomonas sp. On1]MDX2309823.1 hypothetical protein [Pseudomonas sp. On1]HBO7965354.1 hypothetical protein [Pseudomonas aeruginosa]